jgi:hypothetical protein
MKIKEIVDVVLVVLKESQKRGLAIEEERILQSMIKKFFAIRRVHTDGEFIDDEVKAVESELIIWAKEGGQLTAKEVLKRLTNLSQKVKDKKKVEERRRAIEKATPLLFPRESQTPEGVYENKELVRKKYEESQVKSAQDFWAIWGEMQRRTEEEWMFMKRLPFDDLLWYFLGLVGMEAFSIFFHSYQGKVFKMATEAKIERTMALRKRTDEEFTEQVNKWFKRQTDHNLFKKK